MRIKAGRLFKKKEKIKEEFKPYEPWKRLDKYRSTNWLNEPPKIDEKFLRRTRITEQSAGHYTEKEPGKLWGEDI